MSITKLAASAAILFALAAPALANTLTFGVKPTVNMSVAPKFVAGCRCSYLSHPNDVTRPGSPERIAKCVAKYGSACKE